MSFSFISKNALTQLTIFSDSVSSINDPFCCPVEGCVKIFRTKQFFWQHVSYQHFKEEIMSDLPSRVGKHIQCPLCDYKTESPGKRLILYHYAISHRIIHGIFAKKYPDHVLSS